MHASKEKYASPHIPTDPAYRAKVFSALIPLGFVVIASFWLWSFGAVSDLLLSSSTLPTVCEGYTAQECPAAIEASHD